MKTCDDYNQAQPAYAVCVHAMLGAPLARVTLPSVSLGGIGEIFCRLCAGVDVPPDTPRLLCELCVHGLRLLRERRQ